MATIQMPIEIEGTAYEIMKDRVTITFQPCDLPPIQNHDQSELLAQLFSCQKKEEDEEVEKEEIKEEIKEEEEEEEEEKEKKEEEEVEEEERVFSYARKPKSRKRLSVKTHEKGVHTISRRMY